MNSIDVQRIADNAELIVRGYSFTRREDGFFSILNLNHPDCAMVIDHNGEMIDRLKTA